MAIGKIYGIYLNNLRWYQIQNLYKKYLPAGKLKLKIDRINALLDHWESLPDDDLINEYLFAGRVSINWYPLKSIPANTITSLVQRLDEKDPAILTTAVYPRLTESFQIVHAFKTPHKLFMTLGVSGYKDHILIDNYTLRAQGSEYFCTAILRNSEPVLEIRANETIRGQVLFSLMDHIGLETESSTGAVPLTEEQFLKFKDAIPGSQIKKYKGRSIDPANLTEIFDLTARQNVDYSADITEFERMREDLEDLSLTIVFAYNESTFPLRLNLLTRGIYFPAFVTESAIDYIYDIYGETILRG